MPASPDALTRRERELLGEMAQGKNNAAIAAALVISERDLQRRRGQDLVSASVVLPPQFAGFRGFHLHRVGVCDRNAVDAAGARSPFFTAGGHIGSEAGHNHAGHDGDLPSMLVNRDGMVRQTVRTDHVSFERIFDADGTAVIIHAGADNFANIPTRYAPNGPDAATLATGDAGARVVCGVVRR